MPQEIKPEVYPASPNWVRTASLLIYPLIFLCYFDNTLNRTVYIIFAIIFSLLPIIIWKSKIEITKEGVIAHYHPFKKVLTFEHIQKIKIIYNYQAYGTYFYARLKSGKKAYFPVDQMSKHNLKVLSSSFPNVQPHESI